MYSRRAFGQLLAGLPLSLALFRKNSRVAVLPNDIRFASLRSLRSEDSLRLEPTVASQGEIMSNWSLTSPYGIQMDDTGEVWHSALVRDTLQLDGNTILVAADRGGVWRVTNGGDAVPMSDRWDNPDVFCLALGQSGPQHVFAGSIEHKGKGALWMTDPRAPDPLRAWNKISIPDDARGVMNILLLRGMSRVVIATQRGLWWSPFPPITNPFDYRWTQATSGLPMQGVDTWHQISGGPNETVVAAIQHTGLFFGNWVSGVLQMQSARLPSDMSGSQLNRTSIASGASNRRSLFAVSGDGNISFLLSSVDGGRSWQHLNTQVIGEPQGATVASRAGNLGFHNNCIAVSPTDARVVALGWRYGPFVSKDSGRTWQRFNNEVIAELHVDVQSIRFSADGRKLFIGTDGGVAVADVTLGPPTSPFLQNFSSVMNKHLATLQFAGWPSRVVWGTISANSQFAAGGVQDNGNLWCRWRDRSPWRGWDADGQMTLVVKDSDLVFDNASWEPHFLPTLASWDGSRMIEKGIVPVMDPNRRIVPNSLIANDQNAVRGLGSPRELFASTITVPGLTSSRNANFRIHAVAGVDHKVFGLFGDEKPNGYHWEPLGNIPRAAGDFITSVGSYDGMAILVGTNLGRIFRLNPRVSRVEMTPRNVGMITRILVDASAPPALRGFARADNTILQLVGGSTTANQGSWNVLGPVTTADERIWDLAVDWTSEPPRLFAATDEKVYTSLDGRQWEIVSRGLPDVPHCAALQVADGHLFLSTFGRSMWHASLLKSWSNEEDLGGDLTSAPAACTWGPGHVDIFYRGQNNRLWHRRLEGGRWNAAEDLRGVLTDSPTACTWGPGRLDTFYRGQNNHLWHRWFDGVWHDEEDLGGVLTSAPAACAWGRNRLDVFYRGENDHLRHRWFDGVWHTEENVGGVLTSAPTACTWGPNRLDVFYRGWNNRLWHRWFDGVWHDEEDLRGGLTSAPAACTWGPGRLDAFYRGQNNRLWHRSFDSVWHDEEDLRGVLSEVPTACTWGPRRLDAFYRGQNNHLWHRWFPV
jgi:hypothetical protein